jgi:hypothetical protein
VNRQAAASGLPRQASRPVSPRRPPPDRVKAPSSHAMGRGPSQPRPKRLKEPRVRLPLCMRGAARHRLDRRYRFALSERVGVSLQDSSKGRASRVRGVGGDTAASPRAKRASARGRSARLDVVRSRRAGLDHQHDRLHTCKRKPVEGGRRSAGTSRETSGESVLLTGEVAHRDARRCPNGPAREHRRAGRLRRRRRRRIAGHAPPEGDRRAVGGE